jgi:hypothetical protein
MFPCFADKGSAGSLECSLKDWLCSVRVEAGCPPERGQGLSISHPSLSRLIKGKASVEVDEAGICLGHTQPVVSPDALLFKPNKQFLF